MKAIKIITLFLSFLCGINSSFSQSLDEYLLKAKNASDYASMLTAMDSIIVKSEDKNDSIYIEYSLKYIRLATDNNDFKAAAEKAIDVQYALSQTDQGPKAISILTKMLTYEDNIKDSVLIAGLYYRRGRASRHTNLENAIKDFTTAINNYPKTDTLHRSYVHLYRGHSYVDNGRFIDGGEDYNTAYRYFEKLKNYGYMLYAQSGIVNMYSLNGFYKEAKKERDIFIEKAKELDVLDNLPYAYYNQAIDYARTGKDSLALTNLTLAQNYIEYVTDGIGLKVLIDARFCELYCKENDLEKAKVHYNKMNATAVNIESNFKHALIYYGAKATYFHTLGKYNIALDAAQKKREIACQLGHEEELMEANLLISTIYESLGQYHDALLAKSRFLDAKNETYNRTKTNSLAFYQSKYENEKKERELLVKNANIKILENQNNAIKKQVIFVGVTIFLIFGLLLLYRVKQTHKNNKLMQERFSQYLLVSQENERIRISKDLHDGLGQSLLAIKNKLLSNGDQESGKMVNNTIEEVRQITRALHPFQLQELGITKAIEHTISEFDENTSLFISAEIENIDNLFNKEQEVNIYRIVQETLSNIIKHSKAEATKVTVKKTADSMLISVRDNGIGFEFQNALQGKETLGLKILLERAKFLKGQMKVHSKKDTGTLVEFQFPIL